MLLQYRLKSLGQLHSQVMLTRHGVCVVPLDVVLEATAFSLMSLRADEPLVATMVSTLFFFSAAELAWDWVSMVNAHSSAPHGDGITEGEARTRRFKHNLLSFELRKTAQEASVSFRNCAENKSYEKCSVSYCLSTLELAGYILVRGRRVCDDTNRALF